MAITKETVTEARRAHDRATRAAEAAGKEFIAAVAQYFAENEHFIFSAHSRCACGGPLFYREGGGIDGSWSCWLAKNGADGKHETFDFRFFEIKSECQPSAQGASTRPAAMPRHEWLPWQASAFQANPTGER